MCSPQKRTPHLCYYLITGEKSGGRHEFTFIFIIYEQTLREVLFIPNDRISFKFSAATPDLDIKHRF